MTQADFVEFAQPVRRMALTSFIVWHRRILPNLTMRERAVFLALWDYIHVTGWRDATGGELTEFMKSRQLARDVNDVRPRLTGLDQKGWVFRKLIDRPCRNYRNDAHPYVPAVPLAAVDRLKFEVQSST